MEEKFYISDVNSEKFDKIFYRDHGTDVDVFFLENNGKLHHTVAVKEKNGLLDRLRSFSVSSRNGSLVVEYNTAGISIEDKQFVGEFGSAAEAREYIEREF